MEIYRAFFFFAGLSWVLILFYSFWLQIKFIYCFEHIFMGFVLVGWVRVSPFVICTNVDVCACGVDFCHNASNTQTNLMFYRFRSFSLSELFVGKNKNKLFIRCPFFYSIQCFLLDSPSYFSFFLSLYKGKCYYWYCCFSFFFFSDAVYVADHSLFITAVWILNLCTVFQFHSYFFGSLCVCVSFG